MEMSCQIMLDEMFGRLTIVLGHPTSAFVFDVG